MPGCGEVNGKCPSKSFSSEATPSESTAKRQSVNPQTPDRTDHAGRALAGVADPEKNRGTLVGCIARKLHSNIVAFMMFLRCTGWRPVRQPPLPLRASFVRVEDARLLLADATGVVAVEAWGDEAPKLGK